MTLNRIQKLLFTEYSDFEDYVILECPFAQTTRDGRGIQQLQIGLTPSKLILARYFLEKRSHPSIKEDPIIGNLELLSILPIETVVLSVYLRKTRKTIKARFSNRQILYFELAISSRREMFWNLWLERMHSLNPEAKSPLWTEDSEYSSSSMKVSEPHVSSKVKWDERNLYLGPDVSSTNENLPRGVPFSSTNPDQLSLPPTTVKHATPAPVSRRINRFGQDIEENCITSLYLPEGLSSGPVEPKIETKSPLNLAGTMRPATLCQTVCVSKIIDSVWMVKTEQLIEDNRASLITPHSSYYSGFGVADMNKVNALSLQMRKWASEIRLVLPEDEGLRPTSPRLPLTSSKSAKRHNVPEKDETIRLNKRCTARSSLYWDSEDTENESPLTDWYKILRQHLTQLSITDQAAGDHLTHSSDRIDISISSWDFNSTVLSCQLTLTDRDLFLQIRLSEIKTLMSGKTPKNTPRIRRLIDFSERITELVATEIVRVGSLKMRARLIVRYINIANKLHHLQNMNSVHSVLNGLTMPAIYRMTSTWRYLRKHHNSKYKKLIMLVEMYKDVRTPLYSRMVGRFSRNPPFLPCITYLICGLLGQLPGSDSIKTSSRVNSRTHQIRLSSWQPDNGSIISQPRSCSKVPNGDRWDGSSQDAVESILKMWQKAAAGYNLTDSALVKEFLLKSETLSAERIFSFSKETEPNDGN